MEQHQINSKSISVDTLYIILYQCASKLWRSSKIKFKNIHKQEEPKEMWLLNINRILEQM